jgi:hypothetical protein
MASKRFKGIVNGTVHPRAFLFMMNKIRLILGVGLASDSRLIQAGFVVRYTDVLCFCAVMLLLSCFCD